MDPFSSSFSKIRLFDDEEENGDKKEMCATKLIFEVILQRIHVN